MNTIICLKKSASIKNDYKPEIDITSELRLVETAYCLSLLGILQCTVELGRCDMCGGIDALFLSFTTTCRPSLKSVSHLPVLTAEA